MLGLQAHRLDSDRTSDQGRQRPNRLKKGSSRHRRYRPGVECLEGRQVLSAFTEFPLPVANSDPGDLTVGPDGNLWFPYGNPFSYPTTGGIGRITPSGAVSVFPVLGRPGDLTVGPDGNLWFVNGGGIGRITPSGTITGFQLPLCCFDQHKITVGPDGNLWTASGAGIVRITTAGAVTEFPLPSPGKNTGNLTVGPDGNLWLNEYDSSGGPGAIGRITPSGSTYAFPLQSPSNDPGDLTVGPDGNLWFSSYQSVDRITPSGAITEFPVPHMRYFSSGLTVGPDGNLWFREAEYGIGRITPAGVLEEFPLPSAGSLTVGPDGNLWFTELGGIGRITLSGAVTVFPLPDAQSTPGDLTVGPDGRLWFPENREPGYRTGPIPAPTDGRIGKVDPSQVGATGVVAVAHSGRAIRSILLGFDEALDPRTARKPSSYRLAVGVLKRHSTFAWKRVRIGGVSYHRTTNTVRLKLATPQKGPLEVTVHVGIMEPDGVPSFSDFTAVVP
jgi:virginiamycin B lyase